MGLETTFDFPDDLNESNPASTDTRREGDDHLRGIKKVLRNFSKTLDGTVADSSHMEQIYPVGIIICGLTGPTGPGVFFGGTWDLQGSVALDTVEPGSEAAGIVGDEIAFYRRSA